MAREIWLFLLLLWLAAPPLVEQWSRAQAEAVRVAQCGETYAGENELFAAQCVARLARWPWVWLWDDLDMAAWLAAAWHAVLLGAVVAAVRVVGAARHWWWRRGERARMARAMEHVSVKS